MSVYDTSYKKFVKGKLKGAHPTVMQTTISLFSYIDRMAMGRFEWEGIDGNGVALSRKIEEYLFYDRRCAVVDTNEVGLAVVKLVPIGVNINGEPAGYEILTQNGVKLTPRLPRSPYSVGQIGNDNAIILSDSQLYGRGCIDGVWYWVQKFADAQISIDQQMINQRTPLVGLTKNQGDEQFARVQVIDIKSGINALVIDERYGESVKALNLDSQFNVDKLNGMQHEYLSRALSSLGIDSMQAFGKKERLIVDEAESNDEALALILGDCLMARRKPLMDNPTAEEYGISCDLAKPYRISTYRTNKIIYTDSDVPAEDGGDEDERVRDLPYRRGTVRVHVLPRCGRGVQDRLAGHLVLLHRRRTRRGGGGTLSVAVLPVVVPGEGVRDVLRQARDRRSDRTRLQAHAAVVPRPQRGHLRDPTGVLLVGGEQTRDREDRDGRLRRSRRQTARHRQHVQGQGFHRSFGQRTRPPASCGGPSR